MSLPDAVMVFTGQVVIPQFPEWPHRLALLPIGLTIETIGDPCHQQAGIFLIDPDCAHITVNDPALAVYMRQHVPVLLHAARAKDLRPFLRRRDQFQRRGFTLALLP